MSRTRTRPVPACSDLSVSNFRIIFATVTGSRCARHAIARHLAGHPAADDAALIISELAANAVLHSNSADQFFTVRARPDDTSLHLEVEDLGGPWDPAPRDTTRPHGLDVLQALTGPGNWGINGDSTGRTAWARLSW